MGSKRYNIYDCVRAVQLCAKEVHQASISQEDYDWWYREQNLPPSLRTIQNLGWNEILRRAGLPQRPPGRPRNDAR